MKRTVRMEGQGEQGMSRKVRIRENAAQDGGWRGEVFKCPLLKCLIERLLPYALKKKYLHPSFSPIFQRTKNNKQPAAHFDVKCQ